MNMKKKRKKVKKYAVGGDLRGQQPKSAMRLGFRPDGGGGDDGSATGQVRAISKAANRAGDYLSTAGKAIGSGSQRGVGIAGPLPVPFSDPSLPPSPPAPPPFGLDDGQSSDLKKGGKVKRYAKGDMVESKKAAVERRKRAISAGIPDQATSDSISEFDAKGPPKKKKKNKPVKKNMGGMMEYKKGGKVKVRGAGKAIKGVRPAKMIKMKGS